MRGRTVNKGGEIGNEGVANMRAGSEGSRLLLLGFPRTRLKCSIQKNPCTISCFHILKVFIDLLLFSVP